MKLSLWSVRKLHWKALSIFICMVMVLGMNFGAFAAAGGSVGASSGAGGGFAGIMPLAAVTAAFEPADFAEITNYLFNISSGNVDSGASGTARPGANNNTTELRMTTYDRIPFLYFDLENSTAGPVDLKGAEIYGATLELRMNSGGDQIRYVDLSTIAQEWGRGATFFDAKQGRDSRPWYTDDPWAGPENSWFIGSAMTGGHTRYWRESVRYDAATRILSMDVPADMIYAMLNGSTYGMALITAVASDGNKTFNVNAANTMKPTLTVNYSEPPPALDAAIPAISGLTAATVAAEECIYGPSIKLNWVQSGAFSPDMRYEIYYVNENENNTGMALAPNYFTPNADDGAISTLIYGLDNAAPYTFDVKLTNRNGAESSALSVSAATADLEYEPIPIDREAVKNYSNNAYSKDVFVAAGSFAVSVTDSSTKISPVSGDPRLTTGAATAIGNENQTTDLLGGTVSDWAWKKGLYVENDDGWKGISLKMARGERTTFQLPVRRLDDFTYGDPRAVFSVAVNGDLDSAFTVSQTWARGNMRDSAANVNGNNLYSDYTIPLMHSGGEFQIPFELNGELNPLGKGTQEQLQKAMPLFVDVYIKNEVPAGVYSSSINITRSGGATVAIPVQIEIIDYVLPDRTFNLEYNTYGYAPHLALYDADLLQTPEGRALLDDVLKEYQLVCFESGGVLNYVPYYQACNTYYFMRPELGTNSAGLPTVSNWSVYDAFYDPYLTGSYVEAITDRKIPITGMYLPISEDWPMPFYDNHKYDIAFWDYYDSEIGKFPNEDAFLAAYRAGVDFDGLPIPDSVPKNYTATPNSWNEQRAWSYGPEMGDSFVSGYREGIKNIVKEFAYHIDEKIGAGEWSSNTMFQVFFNNKQNFKDWGWNGAGIGGGDRVEWLKWGGLWDWTQNIPTVSELWLARYSQPATSWWQLDEPLRRADWDALGYYGKLVKEAKAELNAEKPGLGDLIQMRTDISCSFVQYDSLDGAQDIPVYNKTFTDAYLNSWNGSGWGAGGLKYAQQRKLDLNENWWVYDGWAGGSTAYANNVNRILSAYAFGAQGFLSYEFIAAHRWYGPEAGYTNAAGGEWPDDSLEREYSIVSGQKFGIDSAFPSFSLKVAGQSSELTRYLDALISERGYTRRQIEQYVAAFINIYGADTAQTVAFTDGSTATYIPDSYMEPLKQDILSKLDVPYFSISGPESVVTGAGATASYTVSAVRMPKSHGIELEFEVDGSVLSSKEFEGLNGFTLLGAAGNYGTPIYWRNIGDRWIGKATLLDMDYAGIGGSIDVLSLVFNVKEGALGSTDVKLNYVALSSAGTSIDVVVDKDIATTILEQYYSPYDLNKDGVIDLNDVTYALQFLLSRPGDADWDLAKVADYNGDGAVDIADLILILANYTVPYYG